MTKKQVRGKEKLINRAIQQNKLAKRADVKVEEEKGYVYISWKSLKRKYKFTVFESGEIMPGFLGRIIETK